MCFMYILIVSLSSLDGYFLSGAFAVGICRLKTLTDALYLYDGKPYLISLTCFHANLCISSNAGGSKYLTVHIYTDSIRFICSHRCSFLFNDDNNSSNNDNSNNDNDNHDSNNNNNANTNEITTMTTYIQ